MEGGARRGRPGYDQQTVLRRAVEVFNRQGYDGTSMGDLARELGVGKSALYHHVPGKEVLLSQALDEALDGLTAVLDRPAGTTAYERLRTAVRDSVRVLVEHLPAVTLLLRVRGNSEVERDALARRREFDRAVTALVLEARDEGSVRADIDPRVVTRLIFGMINSIVEWYRPEGPESADQVASDVLAMALEGLSAS